MRSRVTPVDVGKVDSVTTDSDMVENVGGADEISKISHSVPEIQFTSGLESAILKYNGRFTSRTFRRCQFSPQCFGHGQEILLNDARIRHSE